MYGYIREYECNKLDVPRPMDLTTEVVTLLEKLMLTQAQVSKYMSHHVAMYINLMLAHISAMCVEQSVPILIPDI